MSGRENKRAKLTEDEEANGMQSDFLKGKSNAQFGLQICGHRHLYCVVFVFLFN